MRMRSPYLFLVFLRKRCEAASSAQVETGATRENMNCALH